MTPPLTRRRRAAALRGLTGNRPLTRVAGAYALFTLTEYSVWIAMLVYAYDRGGPTTAGWVALAQLAPAAMVAPLAARIADRRSPVGPLTAGYLAQAAGMAATAAAVAVHRPILAYAAAVVASTAVTTTRPAQAALVPSLANTPEQLTAANVVLSWLEAICIMLAGLLVGALLPVTGVGGVFAVCAVLGGIAALLPTGLRITAQGAGTPAPPEPQKRARAVRDSPLRPLVVLLTAEAVVVGALDLLFVILAVDVLHRSQAWTGYLNLAYGLGAVLVGTVSALLVGRRLGGPVIGSALLLSAALGGLQIRPGLAVTVAVVAVLGACRALLDVAARSLLQRTAPAHEVGRVFGVVEGLTMAGLATGALLVPLLMRLGGSGLALLGVAGVLPLALAVGGGPLLRLDAAARVPVVEIALLRSLPLFAELSPLAIEGLAGSLRRVELPAGAVLMREGDPGDSYYAVASGTLEARQDGGFLRRCTRGEGVGEIALLRDTPRTATVTAITDATVYRLERDPFLVAVSGSPATRRRAGSIAAARLATRPVQDAGS